MGCIYKLTSPSGRYYIGQSRVSAMTRFKAHVSAAKNGHSGCRNLARAILKYGAENFVVETLYDNVPISQLDELEIEAIRKFNATKFGYNIQEGGQATAMTTESRIRQQECWSTKRLDQALEMNLRDAIAFLKYSAKKRRERAKRTGACDVELRWIEDSLKSELQTCIDSSDETMPVFETPPSVADQQRAKWALKRTMKMRSMSDVDAAAYLSKAKSNVLKSAKHRGVDADVERWYPNTLTAAEIAALQANGGVWPSSVPVPQASCAQQEDRAWMIPSDSE